MQKRLNSCTAGLLFLTMFMASLSSAEVLYEAVELGTLGYSGLWDNTEASGINDAGQVVGWSRTVDGRKHAFIWQNGVMEDLGTLGGYESEACAINELGQVAGWSRSPNGSKSAFLWDRVNGMRNLGPLSMAFSDCINDNGQVVGWNSGGTMWDPQRGLARPWSSASFIPYGINDLGQVVGDRDSSSMPVIWDERKLTDLGTLGGSGGRAMAINNSGQVVGYARTGTNAVNPFLWDEQNGMVNLLGITGETGWAFAINELGQVVGGSHVNYNSHVFLWDNANGMTDLSAQLNLTGYLKGSDINNAGQIVAGQYLLSPVPEPGTMGLLAVGGLALVRKRRR